jgi:hypothetical protein
MVDEEDKEPFYGFKREIERYTSDWILMDLNRLIHVPLVNAH